MQTFQFGRKFSLLSTIAINQQFRTLVAQCETEKAGAEGKVNLFRAQPRPAVTSVTPITKPNADALSDCIRLL
jgi:hypothetical protein